MSVLKWLVLEMIFKCLIKLSLTLKIIWEKILNCVCSHLPFSSLSSSCLLCRDLIY